MSFNKLLKATEPVRKFLLVAIAIVLAVGGFLPLITSTEGSAAQLTSRSVTISAAMPDASSLTSTYVFTTATTAAIQSVKFIMCTTAIGTYAGGSCTAPTGCTGGGNNCL